jgi:nitrate reductase cytochrome c-type subunit
MILAGAWLGYRAWPAIHGGSIERFLEKHWMRPLAAQGEPPAGFSPLEASLAPESCASCHPGQYRDWRGSLHARAIGPGLLWQLGLFSPQEANRCLDCHAPLAEQKALFAIERGWPDAPKVAPPSYVGAELHRQGLVCSACHVRRHLRFGPAPKTAAQAGDTPHGGFSVQAAFGDSRFCSVCHQFAPEGRSLAGKLLENTYEEWRTSRAAREGVACQGCHMPDRRHLWRGIHDREMVSDGVKSELAATRLPGGRLAIQARLINAGAGHYFPTYVVPKVTMSVILGQGAAAREVARQVIGRTVNVDMDQEISDTRIPPGGESLLTTEVAAPPGEQPLILRVDVAPAEHYERMFQSMLQRKLDTAARTLLEEALQNASAARYRLDDLELMAPASAGESRRAVAN